MADSFSVRDPKTGETYQVNAIDRVRLLGRGYTDVRAPKRHQQAEAKQQAAKAPSEPEKPKQQQS